MKPGESVIAPMQSVISPGYFEAMGIPLVSGRYFNERDTDTSKLAVIVDEKLARKFWPQGDAVGRRMYSPTDVSNLLKTGPETRWLEVVGVVKDVRLEDLAGKGAPVGAYYFPISQSLRRDFTFAVKTTATPEAATELLRRALREISVLRSLTNAHVVRVHDAGQDESGHVFMLMDELEGAQLDDWHDFDEAMPPGQALWVVHQACLGLAEAHARGIVHRDIKPDNILLVPHGRLTGGGDGTNVRDGSADFVKVVDFGVARWSGPITRPSDVLGTPAFISPETLANEPVDGRSDLYSVGMLLWQMMLGDLPFPAKNQAVMMNSHLSAPRRRPSEVLPQLGRRLPAALETLMVRLIARQPVDRPASAYEVHADLMALLPRVPDVPFEDMALPNFGPCWDGPLDPPEPAVNPAAHSPHGHAPDARAGTADDRRATRRQHVTSPPAAALRSGAASKATRRFYSRLQRFFGVGRGSPHEKSP